MSLLRRLELSKPLKVLKKWYRRVKDRSSRTHQSDSSPSSSFDTTSLSPFATLPIELVQLIIEYSLPALPLWKSYPKRQSTLLSLSLVSRLFCQIAQSLLFQIVFIDGRPPNLDPTARLAIAPIRRLEQSNFAHLIRILKIETGRTRSKRIHSEVELLISKCSALEYLTISGSYPPKRWESLLLDTRIKTLSLHSPSPSSTQPQPIHLTHITLSPLSVGISNILNSTILPYLHSCTLIATDTYEEWGDSYHPVRFDDMGYAGSERSWMQTNSTESTETTDDDEASTRSDLSRYTRHYAEKIARSVLEQSSFLRNLKSLALDASIINQLGAEVFSLLADKTLVYWDFVYEPRSFPWHLVQYLAVPLIKIARQVVAISETVKDETKTPALRALFLSDHLGNMSRDYDARRTACDNFEMRGLDIIWTKWAPDWGLVPANWPAFQARSTVENENEHENENA